MGEKMGTLATILVVALIIVLFLAWWFNRPAQGGDLIPIDPPPSGNTISIAAITVTKPPNIISWTQSNWLAGIQPETVGSWTVIFTNSKDVPITNVKIQVDDVHGFFTDNAYYSGLYWPEGFYSFPLMSQYSVSGGYNYFADCSAQQSRSLIFGSSSYILEAKQTRTVFFVGGRNFGDFGKEPNYSASYVILPFIASSITSGTYTFPVKVWFTDLSTGIEHTETVSWRITVNA